MPWRVPKLTSGSSARDATRYEERAFARKPTRSDPKFVQPAKPPLPGPSIPAPSTPEPSADDLFDDEPGDNKPPAAEPGDEMPADNMPADDTATPEENDNSDTPADDARPRPMREARSATTKYDQPPHGGQMTCRLTTCQPATASRAPLTRAPSAIARDSR